VIGVNYLMKKKKIENIFSWTIPGPVAFENGHGLIFSRQVRKKIHFTKSHIKILLVNKLILVSPLSF